MEQVHIPGGFKTVPS